MSNTLPLPQFVIVEWDDPNSSSVEVITEENLEAFHVPEAMKTAGWLLRDDDRGVSIANEVYFERDKPRWRGHTFIMRALIRAVTPAKLQVSKKRKTAILGPGMIVRT